LINFFARQMDIRGNIKKIVDSLAPGVKVVAVTKTRTIPEIMEAYDAGHRIFGENKVQELAGKQELLPGDIEWHMVGHLQTNKVKYIAPYVSLIHGVDSLKLLRTVNKEAFKNNRVIDCLLQVHIALEETKFGFSEEELEGLLDQLPSEDLLNVRISGLMGMATFTSDNDLIRSEFRYLAELFRKLKKSFFREKNYFCELSMGMSGDYLIAVEEGSTIVRIGSLIFGEREY